MSVEVECSLTPVETKVFRWDMQLGACKGDLRNSALAELPVLLLSFTAQKGIEISGIMIGALIYGNFALSFTLYSSVEVAILLTMYWRVALCMSKELF